MSQVKELNEVFTHFNEVKILDATYDLAESAVDVARVRPYLRDAEDRALPKILRIALRHGNVESVGYTRLDLLDDPAFAFEGMVLRQVKSQLQYAYYHYKGFRISSFEFQEK